MFESNGEQEISFGLDVAVARKVLIDTGREEKTFILIGGAGIPINGTAGTGQVPTRACIDTPKTGQANIRCGDKQKESNLVKNQTVISRGQ